MRNRPLRGIWLRSWRRRRVSGQILVPVLLGVAAAAFLIHQFNAALRPQLITLAQVKLQNQLLLISNEAVTDTLKQQELRYSDMVLMDPGAGVGIATLTTETVRLNDFRSALLERIVSQVETLDSRCLGVPLGALTGVDIISGSGPNLPVKVLSVASAEGAYRNDFIGAGINQTLHRVMLDITVTAKILMPGGIVDAVVSTPVCVAETIIIGQVPQTYVGLNQ